MDVQVRFNKHENGPERLVCDAELIFGDGPLAGMKLVGFSLWRGADDETYVTFPSRAFGGGSERRYFDYLRTVDRDAPAAARRVKAWIIEEWRAQQISEQA